MMANLVRCSIVLLGLASLSCPGKAVGAGEHPGDGLCDGTTLKFADPSTFVQPLPLAGRTLEASMCGGGREGMKKAVTIPDSRATNGEHLCICDTPQTVTRTDGTTRIIDVGAQSGLTGGGGCRGTLHYVSTKCRQLGYVNGFVSRDYTFAGLAHDGDMYMGVCPFESGVHNGREPEPWRDLDVRSASAFTTPMTRAELDGGIDHQLQQAYGRIHVENMWCRQYLGAVSVAEHAAEPLNNIPTLPGQFFPKFAYQGGERVSMVGDWVIDGDHTELHEVRVTSVLREDRRTPNVPVYFLLTSGHFAPNTAQANTIAISVPIPEPEGGWGRWKLHCRPATIGVGEGCNLHEEFDETSVVAKEIPPGSGNWTCTITVRRGNRPSGRLQCSNPSWVDDAQCPCVDVDPEHLKSKPEDAKWTCRAQGKSSIDGFADKCRFKDLKGTPTEADQFASVINYAGVVRAILVDPEDHWSCNCECDDPSQPGAVIEAHVQGCAPTGLDQDRPSNRFEACLRVCGGTMCGSAPHCRIGTCRPKLEPSAKGALRLATQGCLPPPDVRVARAGDYRIELDGAASKVELGTLDGSTLNVEATAAVSGTIFVNDNGSETDRRLEFAQFRTIVEDFTIPVQKLFGIPVAHAKVESTSAFVPRRFSALFGPRSVTVFGVTTELPAGAFVVMPGEVQFVVRARVEGGLGGTEFINQGPFFGTFDSVANTFTLEGIGRDQEGARPASPSSGTSSTIRPWRIPARIAPSNALRRRRPR